MLNYFLLILTVSVLIGFSGSVVQDALAITSPNGKWDFIIPEKVGVEQFYSNSFFPAMLVDVPVKYQGTEPYGSVIVWLLTTEDNGQDHYQSQRISNMEKDSKTNVTFIQPLTQDDNGSYKIVLTNPDEINVKPHIFYTFKDQFDRKEVNSSENITFEHYEDKIVIEVDPKKLIGPDKSIQISMNSNLSKYIKEIIFKNRQIGVTSISPEKFTIYFDSQLDLGYQKFQIELIKKFSTVGIEKDYVANAAEENSLDFTSDIKMTVISSDICYSNNCELIDREIFVFLPFFVAIIGGFLFALFLKCKLYTWEIEEVRNESELRQRELAKAKVHIAQKMLLYVPGYDVLSKEYPDLTKENNYD